MKDFLSLAHSLAFSSNSISTNIRTWRMTFMLTLVASHSIDFEMDDSAHFLLNIYASIPLLVSVFNSCESATFSALLYTITLIVANHANVFSSFSGGYFQNKDTYSAIFAFYACARSNSKMKLARADNLNTQFKHGICPRVLSLIIKFLNTFRILEHFTQFISLYLSSSDLRFVPSFTAHNDR